MRRLLLVSIFAFLLSGGCIMPPDTQNPTIEKSSPEKPKKQVEIEKALKEEFNKPPAPVPER